MLAWPIPSRLEHVNGVRGVKLFSIIIFENCLFVSAQCVVLCNALVTDSVDAFV